MDIAVVSGKGGTGKSSISAAFATLSSRVVLADCDVEAANLYLLFNPVHEEEIIYIGGEKVKIDYELCTNCRLCEEYCRFGALKFEGDRVVVSTVTCDGCRLCARICKTGAITVTQNDKSRMYAGSFRNGKMVYGRLAPGEENSGKLVNLVREKAKKISEENNIDIVIIDGPPGIGCPVISSITGVDHVVIIAEPTISGALDLIRTLEIVQKFQLKIWVIINKCDLNFGMADQITKYCNSIDVRIAGELLFDPLVVEAMVNCKSIIEWAPDSVFSAEIERAFNKITQGE